MAGIIKGAGAAGLLAAADQIIKNYVEKHVEDQEEKKLGRRIIVRKAHNKGACMNLFDSRPDVVRILSLFLCLVLAFRQVCTFEKKGQLCEKAGLTLLAGGAWSNTLDRWARGYVVDYIAVNGKKGSGNITFNLGDVFIFLGSILFSLCSDTCIFGTGRYNNKAGLKRQNTEIKRKQETDK